jgi:hypothetical protein
VDPRAGLDDVEKRKFLILPGLELRPLGCPARSQSLHRLRYPGSFTFNINAGNQRIFLPVTSNMTEIPNNSRLSVCPNAPLSHFLLVDLNSIF